MAKRSGGPNKSASIRAYLDANPDAKPREIVDALKSQGLTVSPAFVSTIKSKAGSSEGKATARRGRPKGATRKAATATRGGKRTSKGAAPATSTRSSSNNESVSVDELVMAKKLADQLGGVKQARAALSALEKITG